jgi:hypothetical protein
MEDAMTTTFRKALMATTVLAGLAIFALDAAQAGPNGPSNIGGSISGFSSMRMDFNRVGGPNRLLARDEMRIVPLDVTKKADKGASKKSAAKKGTDLARVSNPKSVTGGKGKEIASNGPNLHVPGAIAELLRLTGGNLDDISKFADIAGWLKTGPLVVANPLFPQQGDSSFTPPEFPGSGPKGGEQSDRNFLDGWAGYSSTPQPFANPEGKVSTFHTVYENRDDGRGHGTTETYYKNPESGETTYIREEGTRQGGERTTTTATFREGGRMTRVFNTDNNGDTTITETEESAPRSETRDGQTVQVTDYVETVYYPDGTSSTDKGQIVVPKKEDSQPVEEGTGRPGRSGWCSPTGGCVIASPIPPRRIIPTEDSTTPEAHRQSPSWATDPNPDGYNTGGGGGYNGYRPQDEEGGGIGGPGNPELSALGTPL